MRDSDDSPYYVKTQPLAEQLLAGMLLNQEESKTRIGQFQADVVLTMDLTNWFNGSQGTVDSRVWDLIQRSSYGAPATR